MVTVQTCPRRLPTYDGSLRRPGSGSAVRDAVSYLDTALQTLADLPEDAERDRQELAIQLRLALLFASLRGYGSRERLEASLRARELARRLGDETRLASILRNLGDVWINIQQYGRARQIIEELTELAGRTGYPIAHYHLAYVKAHLFWRIGNYSEGCSSSEWLIDHLDELSGKRPKETLDAEAVWARLFLCFCLTILGYIDRAREVELELSALAARSPRHGYIEGLAMLASTYLNMLLRDVTKTRAVAQQRKEIAEELDAQTFERACECHGWAVAAQGRISEGIAEINSVDRSGLGLEPDTFHCFVLSDSFLRGGFGSEALEWAERGLATADKVGERWVEAELWRLCGEASLLDKNGSSSEAEQSFRSAIEAARKDSARLFELRATISFARLLRDTNRRDEARAMLTKIYGWFAEGFDTADLKDAKALLDELSA
jgi:tetratricopeptide (TPR) repeat protein